MNTKTNDLVKAGLLLSLGILLPIIFHQFKLGGPVFLPMHIPVLLAGFIAGKKYGFLVGILTPFLSSVFTGMPPIYPTAVSMAFELGTYGLISGLLFETIKSENKITKTYISLIIAMLAGRIVSGIANYILFTFAMGKPYLLKMFLTSAFITPIPGIIIQLILIPFLVIFLSKVTITGGQNFER
ncbi:hypothetical protein Q428_15015 [Fervidicella metallireducens AeB]|uniref:ECF transporter S component n=1 Tax=Fervidicella metallireducens AeB TaxID=1403537 RepID=A0A017RR78_9CLOT|nr:ECF transporter S component [Fervidicella metallireducens]EYE87142.1 hypothetical protein Q428_15015 [Fervidicella metallireducens AeB]